MADRPAPDPADRTVLTRAVYGLLVLVAAAAAVLSFSALRELAVVCGFSTGLAWLLPVVVDAGAAAGSVVWLGGTAPAPARRFARALALTLLGSSVAANAVGHGLAAYGLAPAWWVVVIVSAIAPAVLGAVVHLAVLVARPDREQAGQTGADQGQTTGPDQAGDEAVGPVRGELTDARERQLVDQLAQLHARGDALPSGRQLRRDHGIGPDRAARILRDAADTAQAGPRAVGS